MNPPAACKKPITRSTTAPSPAIATLSILAPLFVLVNAVTNATTATTSAPTPVAIIAPLVSFSPLIKAFVPCAAFLKPVTAPPVILSNAVAAPSMPVPRLLVALSTLFICCVALSAPLITTPTSIFSDISTCFDCLFYFFKKSTKARVFIITI